MITMMYKRADSASDGFNMNIVPFEDDGQHNKAYVDEWWKRRKDYFYNEKYKQYAGMTSVLDKLWEAESRRNPELWDRAAAEKAHKEIVDEANRIVGPNNFWRRKGYRLLNLGVPSIGGEAIGNALYNKWVSDTAAKPNISGYKALALQREIHRRMQDPLDEQDRRLTAAMHLSSQAGNGLGLGLVTKVMSGGTRNDWSEGIAGEGATADNLAREYGQKYAEKYGEEAAKKAEMWLRLGGTGMYAAGAAGVSALGGAALKPLQAATQAYTWAKPLGMAAKLGVTGLSSYNTWRPWSTGFENLGTSLATGGYNRAAAVSNVASDFARSMPVYAMSAAASAPVLARLGLTPYVNPGTAFTHPLKFMAADLVTGPTDFLADSVNAMRTGQKLDPGMALGNWNNMIFHGANKFLSGKSDAWATMYNAGAADKELQDTLDSIDRDPKILEQYREALGVPDITADELKEYLTQTASSQRQQNMEYQVLHAIDPKQNWDSMSPEEAQAIYAKYPPEFRAKKKFEVYRNEAVRGGAMDTSMFSDTELSPEQRQQLLKDYIMSVDNANGGTLIGQMVRGEKQVLRDAMASSPEVRSAVIAYGQGAVADALSKGSAGPLPAAAKDVLSMMKPDELQAVMAPLNYASVDQIMDLQRGGSLADLGNIKPVAEQAIMNRLQKDGDFAAKFIPQFANAMAEGVNLTDEDKSTAAALLSNMDPDEMFSNMSDDQFIDTARFMLGNNGQFLEGMPQEQANELQLKFTSAARSRMWEAVKSNPLKNMPIAASLWAKSNGWDMLGSVAENPWAFYGIAAALLLGGVWLTSGLFGRDDSSRSIATNTANDAELLSRMGQQRSLLMGNYPGAY